MVCIFCTLKYFISITEKKIKLPFNYETRNGILRKIESIYNYEEYGNCIIFEKISHKIKLFLSVCFERELLVQFKKLLLTKRFSKNESNTFETSFLIV